MSTKISALPARLAVALTDIVPIVDVASGLPATQKATVAQLRAALMPVVLSADVSGTLSAANQASQVAGANTQFQWNNAGAFAGAAGFTYDLATTQARVGPNCGVLFRNIANTFDGRIFWNVSAAQTIVFPDVTGTAVIADAAQTLTNKTIDAPSNTITNIANANVSATAAIAGTKISPDFGAQNVKTTGAFLVGTVPGMRDNGGGNLYVGTDTSFATQATNLNVYAGSAVALGLSGNTYFYIFSGHVEAWKPLTGSATGASPFSVDGRMPVRSLAALATYTAAAAEYALQCLQFSGSPTANACTVTIPDPATEDASYFKDIDVAAVASTATVTIKAGAGTRTAAIVGGGFAGPSAASPPKRVWVTPGCVDLAPG